MCWGPFASFLILAALLVTGADRQTVNRDGQTEQTSFGADPPPGQQFIRKPLQLPAAALQVLRDTLDRGTLNCLKHNGITPDEVPAAWFVASEIHLDGPEEVDLIVQPNLPRIATHDLPHYEAAGCLLGANVGPFWVLRNTSGRYNLLLETYALGLEVLDSRSNFYRDIQTVASTAVTRTTILYKMAVAQYQIAENKVAP